MARCGILYPKWENARHRSEGITTGPMHRLDKFSKIPKRLFWSLKNLNHQQTTGAGFSAKIRIELLLKAPRRLLSPGPIYTYRFSSWANILRSFAHTLSQRPVPKTNAMGFFILICDTTRNPKLRGLMAQLRVKWARVARRFQFCAIRSGVE